MQSSPANITKAIEVLKDGGIVTHATETCYGLAVDLLSQKAVIRLFGQKQRPLDKPVSALFPNIEAAKQYVEWNDKAQALADEHLPGPVTLVLPIKSEWLDKIFEVPDPSISAKRTLGIRISPHPTAMALATAINPISTTSANIHGQPSPYAATGLIGDVILNDGELPTVPTSRLIIV